VTKFEDAAAKAAEAAKRALPFFSERDSQEGRVVRYQPRTEISPARRFWKSRATRGPLVPVLCPSMAIHYGYEAIYCSNLNSNWGRLNIRLMTQY